MKPCCMVSLHRSRPCSGISFPMYVIQESGIISHTWRGLGGTGRIPPCTNKHTHNNPWKVSGLPLTYGSICLQFPEGPYQASLSQNSSSHQPHSPGCRPKQGGRVHRPPGKKAGEAWPHEQECSTQMILGDFQQKEWFGQRPAYEGCGILRGYKRPWPQP